MSNEGFSFGSLDRDRPASASATEPASSPRGPLPYVTLALCAVCSLLSAAIWAEGARPSWEALARWGYLPPDRVWDGGYWSLLVACFVHLSLWHLVFNVYWLWVLGGLVERTLGRARFLAFILVAGFVSSAIQLGASGETGHGASGLGYAFFGLLWGGRHRVPEFRVLTDRVGTPFWVWLVGCFIATRAGFANVGNAAHLGGLLFGLAVSPWLVVKVPRWRLALWSSIGFVGISVLVSFWSPWSSRWQFHRACKAQVAGDYTVAIDGYKRSIALDAGDIWSYKNLALSYYATGAHGDYEATLTRLRAIDSAAANDVTERVSGR